MSTIAATAQKSSPDVIPSHRGLTLLLGSLAALGPFTIDAYLPSFRDIGRTFGATPEVVQQTMTAYLVPFAAMTLWHGALSDTFGRRRVTLVAIALFALASVGCMMAWSIGSLTFFRALQGASVGAGTVIGRAIVRDVFDGAEARRLMSTIALLFAVAPAVGPIIGGWLQVAFGWRSVFVFLSLFAALVWLACWKALPETLPAERRQPLHARSLLAGYGAVLRSGPFVALVVALTMNFAANFLYVVSAPAFVFYALQRSETEFYWLFGPLTAGMMLGNVAAGRLAARWSHHRMLLVGYAVMALAAASNLLFHLHHSAELPWSVLPLGFFAFGVTLTMPSLTLMALDLFPARRGLAASCQSFVQTGGNALVAAFLAPALWSSAHQLSVGMLGLLATGILAMVVFTMIQRTTSHHGLAGADSAGLGSMNSK